jgi:hypothetical protein
MKVVIIVIFLSFKLFSQELPTATTDSIYVLVFEDYKHFVSKNNYIVYDFTSMIELKVFLKKLLLMYLLEGLSEPFHDIVIHKKEREFYYEK